MNTLRHIITTLCLGLLSIAAQAAVEVNGIWYELKESGTSNVYEAIVTTNQDGIRYSGEINIPSKIDFSGTSYTVTSIGGYSFMFCEGLSSVTIPNSVTSIGDYAFEYCTGLTSVTIPNSVTSIGIGTFYACSSLISVTIPTSVKSIGNYAFNSCTGLPSVIIPPSVTSIGDRAFECCSGLTSVIIPPSVTSIGDYAFTSCNGLKKSAYPKILNDPFHNGRAFAYNPDGAIIEDEFIFGPNKSSILFAPYTLHGEYIIPNSVTSIGESSFMYCEGLTSVTIPNSVTSIGNYAFHSCTALTSVTIPNSVTSIGMGTFCNCSSLISATIPTSVTSIGSSAFMDCNSLTSLTIPNSVTSIREGTFSACRGLTSVIIPPSVTSIGDGAFAGCGGLKKSAYPEILDNPFSYGVAVAYNPNGAIIEDEFIFGPNKSSILFAPYTLHDEYIIPNFVTSIGPRAFCGCNSLNAVTSLAYKAPIIAENAFDGLYEKTTLSFPKNALTSYLGSNWSLFKSVKFTDSNLALKNYSDGILDYWLLDADSETDKNIAIVKNGEYSNLTSVTVPERLSANDSRRYYITGLGYAAFKNCKTLNNVYFHSKSIVSFIGDAAFEGTAINTINLPISVSHIGKGAFKNSSLNSFAFPSSVAAIEDETFHGCNSLYSFEIPASVVSVGDGAFRLCTNLSSVIIPNSVKLIKNNAFSDCCCLTSIILPNSITSIGNNTFSSCGLKSLTIPSSVKSIGDNAFSNCYTLTSVIIPTSVTSIGDNAFLNCHTLTSVIIPSSVTSIGNNAFDGCTGLIKSAYPNTLVNPFSNGFAVAYDPQETIMENGFMYGSKKSSIVFVPHTFTGTYIIPNSVVSVGVSAFAGCANLSSIEIGSEIKTIPDSAFAKCGLTQVVIPPAVESIGNSAFSGNTSLKEAAIGPNVKSIGDKAFDNTPLERVYITAPEPPAAPYSAFSRYTAKLYVQGETAINAYYDATSCWDRFEGYAMSEPTSLTISEIVTLPKKAGDTVALRATLTPINVDLPYVFWRSTNPEKATVDNNGVLTLLQDYVEGDDWKIIAETLYHNGPTAIFSLNNNISTGVDDITGDTSSSMNVYTLQGVQVLRNATREQFDNLASGIYIVRNGKDVKKIVK